MHFFDEYGVIVVASAFSDSSMASGSLMASEDLKNYNRYDYEIWNQFGIYKEAQNQKKTDMSGPVCKL